MERMYIIPIKRKVLNVPRWRRAKKAMKVIREFVRRHMKTNEVKIDTKINELIWQFGGKDVPSKIKVIVSKEEKENVAKVKLFEEKKKGEKKEEKKVKKEKEGKEGQKEEKKEKKKEVKGGEKNE